MHSISFSLCIYNQKFYLKCTGEFVEYSQRGSISHTVGSSDDDDDENNYLYLFVFILY